jgi:hypothetical protein
VANVEEVGNSAGVCESHYRQQIPSSGQRPRASGSQTCRENVEVMGDGGWETSLCVIKPTERMWRLGRQTGMAGGREATPCLAEGGRRRGHGGAHTPMVGLVVPLTARSEEGDDFLLFSFLVFRNSVFLIGLTCGTQSTLSNCT